MKIQFFLKFNLFFLFIYLGRTNKLVDACYTWWQGAVAVLLHQRLNIDIAALAIGDEANNDDGDDDDRERRQSIAGSWLLIDQIALQRYVLACCQDERGGLFDKPGKYVFRVFDFFFIRFHYFNNNKKIKQKKT